MIQTNRRGFLTGLVAFTAAAPAIVRAASLMQIRAPIILRPPYNMLTLQMITREAFKLFRDSNESLQDISAQYDAEFGLSNARVGTTLRVHLPADFKVKDTVSLCNV